VTSPRLRDAGLLGLAVLAFALAYGQRAGAQSLTLDVGGMPRSFEIHAPRPGPPPRALVIALHGLGQAIVDLRRDLGLDALAVRENFVVVYPRGVDGRWNYGRQLNRPMPLVAGAEVDDVAFLRELIAHLISRSDVDPKRVYLLGVSNGALMAYRALCDMGGELAAVAAFISGMSEFQQDECRGASLPPLLMLAGSGDTFQLYAGGPARLGRIVSVPDTFGFFRGRQGCTGVQSEELPDLDPEDGTTVTVFRARGCRPGVEVVFYRINGGGHQVPTLAPRDTRPHPRFGRTNRDIDSAREAWDFFRRFKLP
jgi:polyhydroxybutyrate depolymerase